MNAGVQKDGRIKQDGKQEFERHKCHGVTKLLQKVAVVEKQRQKPVMVKRAKARLP